MNDTQGSTSDQFSARALIIAILASVLITFGFLEYAGMIKHSENKDEFALSSYKAVLIEAQDQAEYLLSPKPSFQHAKCIDGYLFIANDKDTALQGLLVDYKNRGIKCNPESLTNIVQPAGALEKNDG